MSSTPLPERSPGGSGRRGEAARVLAGVASARTVREQAERDQLSRVLDWAVLHQATPTRTGAVSTGGNVFEEPCLALAGPGAPRVPEYAALELAAALGLSTEAGLDYLGNAIEVRYRLPRLWARLSAGERRGLTVWRAFRIAAQTRVLCAAGAAEVDERLSGFAHTVGAAQIDRTVSAAMAAHDPDTAAALAAEAKDARRFDVHLTGAIPADRQGLRAITGVVSVIGLLDLRDALDLEAAVAAGAARLAGLTGPVGDRDDTDDTDDSCAAPVLSLDVRRSIAVGDLARHQLTLDLDTTSEANRGGTAPGAGGVVVYAHLHPDTPTIELDTPGATGIRTWVGVLKDWCQTAGTQVTIKPVLDLASNPVSTGYQPSATVTEVVELRDRRCRFPWCTRPARVCDQDHRTDFDDGGPTSAHNMAPLCRRHHRAKTHSDWTYQHTSGAPPGHYTWTSPTGLRITVDPHGTHTLDPPT